MKFEIINPKPLNRNTLRGFFVLKVGPFEIGGYSYHQKDGKAWVNPPSREYMDKETNELKYAPMIRIPDKDRYAKFQDWATAECRKVFSSAPEAVKDADDNFPF